MTTPLPPTGAPADSDASDRLRIYDSLRSAHLERLGTMVPAAMWYFGRRADFDESLVDPSNAPVHVTRRGALAALLRRPPRVIELNEPAMVDQWKFLVPAVAAVTLHDLVARRRTVIATYCIENADPTRQVEDRWGVPHRLAPLLVRMVMGLLVRRMDRVAFGTRGAQQMYRGHVSDRVLDRRCELFEAVPAACSCPVDPALPRQRNQVVFIGSFVERKGIAQTMAAWDALHRELPDAHLVVVGAGRLLDEVEAWASDRDDVDLVVDPPRERIHRVLRESSVLVLLSQPHGHWREQVGLPIVEALAHGLEVVASSQTGLADWLRDHGHEVVAADAAPRTVAAAIGRALESATRRDGSSEQLPETDQRIAADHWMMRG